MGETERELCHTLHGGDDSQLDHNHRLRLHIPCSICAYDLFGLQNGEQCPECGAPIAMSLHGDHLQYSRPRWLRRVGQSARLAALALILLPLAAALALVWPVLTGNLLPVLTALWSGAAVVAAWRDSAQQQRLPGAVSAEASAIVAGLLSVAHLLVSALLGTSMLPIATSWLLAGAFVVAAVLHVRWLGRLALRVPVPEQWDTLRTRSFYFVASATIFLLSTLSSWLLATLLLLFAGPLWLLGTWLLAYSCLQASELILVESRRARENVVLYSALLNKEERWRRPPKPASTTHPHPEARD